MFDIRSSVSMAVAMASVTLSGTTPANGLVFDRRGFGSVAFAISAAAVTAAGSSGVTFSVEESDTTADADFAAAPADEVHGVDELEDIAADSPLGIIGYTGNKRYLRLVATGSASTDAVVSATALLSHKDHEPGTMTVASADAT